MQTQTVGLSFQTSDGAQSSASSVPGAVLFPAVVQTPQAPPVGGPTAPPKPMEELDLLGKTLLQQSLPPESQQVKWWVCLFDALILHSPEV